MSTVNGFQVGSEILKYNYESLENYNTPNFSTSSTETYAVGDYVMYNGKLYKCTTATTGGTWVNDNWIEAVLSDDVSELNRQLSDVEENKIPDLKSAINDIEDTQTIKVNYDVYPGNYTDPSATNALHTNIIKMSDILTVVTTIRTAGTLTGVPAIPNGDGTYTYGTAWTINANAQTAEHDVTDVIRAKLVAANTDYVGFIGTTSIQTELARFNEWMIIVADTGLNKRLKSVESGNLDSFSGIKNHVSEITLCNPILDFKGFITANGSFQNTQTASNKEKRSDYISITSGTTYTFSGWVKTESANLWAAYCLYDSTKTPVGSRVVPASNIWTEGLYSGFSTNISIPNDSTAEYIVVTARTFGDAYFAFTYKSIGITTLEMLRFQYQNDTNNKAYIENKIVDFYTDHSLVKYLEQTANVVSIAHRGFVGARAPENTMAAFKEAKRNGFLRIETDVRSTSDGVLVCLHDDTVDRTSDGSGKISEMTYAQASALDFGNASYPNQKIPTFNEYLSFCKQAGIRPYIEIKDHTLVSAMVAAAFDYGLVNVATWLGNGSTVLDTVIELIPNARVELLGVNDDLITWAIGKKANGIEVVFYTTFSSLTTEQKEAIIENQFVVNAGVSTQANILALDPYVSEITTNDKMASVVLYNAAMQ